MEVNNDQITALTTKNGTPLFVYSSQTLRQQARQMLSVPAPYGLTIRYAMKANPNTGILAVLKSEKIWVDASSGYEAQLALQGSPMHAQAA